MGAFHCPLGAMSPGQEGCIRCGLCSAQTKAEYAAAAETLRSYLRSHAVTPSQIKKVAVCGKGGVGKSTITSALARALVDFGYRVLVVDTDESNPALSRALGISSPARPLRAMDDQFEPIDCGEWVEQESYTMDQIPEAFISHSGNLSLITVGKIEDPFQGCACRFGALAAVWSVVWILY